MDQANAVGPTSVDGSFFLVRIACDWLVAGCPLVLIVPLRLHLCNAMTKVLGPLFLGGGDTQKYLLVFLLPVDTRHVLVS